MTERVLITAALLYANGPLHFGHIAGAYLAADVYARFCRLQQRETLFVCGSDEYGVAITMSAEREGRAPREHAEHYHEVNKELFERLEFSFDHYSRTSWPGHKVPVEQFFRDLLANGYVEARETKELYSEEEERFLADRYVVGTCPACGFEEARGDECGACGASYEATDLGRPRSKMSAAPLVLKETTHWYLRLDLLKDKLKSWIKGKRWKPTVLHFLESYFNDPRPRAITRDAEWGVPVPLPEAKGKVFYVWFEALIGYISASMDWAIRQGDPEAWRAFWMDESTKLVHFVGKDNIFFHGLFFPAMTMGQNEPYKLVDELPANEFLMLEGRQFSKSEGWYIDLATFLDTYSADQLRYTLAASAPETSDAEFTWRGFQLRCNSELVGKWGNLANRTLVFAKKQCEGKIPAALELSDVDQHFLEEIKRLTNEICAAYESFSLRHACHLIMELARAGNGYFDTKQPWVTAKEPSMRASMETTIRLCLECLRCLALCSSPVIPKAAETLWQLIGFKEPLETQGWKKGLALPLREGSALPSPTILFQKIEDAQVEAELAKLNA